MRQLKITKSITNRESASLERYLQEISRVELLTIDEEVELARRIKKGDTIALEKLTKANLRFVVSVAKQYQNAGLGLADLINEGNLGLMKAAERFDDSRGFKFITYAVWWIRQSIIQALAEQSRIVRLPLNKIGALQKINHAFAELEQKYEREPSPEEIAHILNVELDEVRTNLGVAGKHISMDAPFVKGEENSLLDVLVNQDSEPADRNVAFVESLRLEIDNTLSMLGDKQAEVLRMFFGIGLEEPMSLDDIGIRYNLSRERARQIKDKALIKLKASSKCKQLKAYLG